MATYGGWTEMREYRVWQGEELYSVVSVEQHRNGRVRVFVDSELYSGTASLSDAYSDAHERARELQGEAEASCTCGEDADECGRVYDAPHGVRLQITDVEENRTLDPWEL